MPPSVLVVGPKLLPEFLEEVQLKTLDQCLQLKVGHKLELVRIELAGKLELLP